MRHLAAAVTIATLLAAAPGRAFDASGADILGLRLGMTEPEIAGRLTHQGFPMTRTVSPCQGRETCPVTIKAITRDGNLNITLSGATGATRIDYTFLGHQSHEPAAIQTAMTDRFGRPDQLTPMGWCRTVSAGGACSRQQASLTFVLDTLTVTLKSGDTEAP